MYINIYISFFSFIILRCLIIINLFIIIFIVHFIVTLYIFIFIYMHAIRYVAFVDFRKKKFQSGFQVMFKLQLDISQLYKYIPWGYIFQKQLEVWPNWEKHSCYCDFYIASLCSGQGWCCSLHLSVFLQLYATCWVSRPTCWVFTCWHSLRWDFTFLAEAFLELAC